MSRSNRPMSQDAGKAFGAAYSFAKLFGHRQINSEHLLLGILKTPDCEATSSLKKLGAKPYELSDKLREEMSITKAEEFFEGSISKSSEIKEIESLANLEAQKQYSDLISTRHLLYAIFQSPYCKASKWIQFHGVTLTDLQNMPIQSKEQTQLSNDNWSYFTETAKTVLGRAQLIATENNQTSITNSHILLAILETPESDANRRLTALIDDLETLSANLLNDIKHVDELSNSPSQITLTDELKRMLEIAVEESRKASNAQYVDTYFLLLGIIRESTSYAAHVIEKSYIAIEQIRAQPRYIQEHPVRNSAIRGIKKSILKLLKRN